jgi:hypothetical protein
MGILDAPMRAVAKTLVPKFGTVASIERDGAYSTITDSIGASTSYACNVVFDAVETHIQDGSSRSGDRVALIAALDISIVPDPEKDRLKVGTESWQVLRNLPVQPGATAILHVLHVRR